MREVRKLYSPIHGAVSSLCELNTGGERHHGEGFAVSARSFPARLYYRLIPAAEVLSPADGARHCRRERRFPPENRRRSGA